jgi:hypothetical protein
MLMRLGIICLVFAGMIAVVNAKETGGKKQSVGQNNSLPPTAIIDKPTSASPQANPPAQKLPEASKGIEWSNWALVFVGSLGVVAAFITLLEIGKQTKASKDAASAALLNAQAVITAERAWVMADLDGAPLAIFEATGTFWGGPLVETTEIQNVKLTCRNQGRSPAWIDRVRAQVDIVDSDSVSIDPILRKGTHGPMVPLGAGEEESRILKLRCEGRRKPEEFLSIYVLIEYRDIFGEKRETQLGYSVHDNLIHRQNGLPGRNRNT